MYIRKKVIFALLTILVLVGIFIKVHAKTDEELPVTNFKYDANILVKESAIALNQAIKDYHNSDEYKMYKLKTKIENETGIKIKELQAITCNITYYSSLACENGKYGLKTASGIMMNGKTVANNFLSFGTDLYINGYGHKVVHDRGSSKHFNTVNRFDVYVPRNSGESDSVYYKRVNNMGRKTVTGYILVEE